MAAQGTETHAPSAGEYIVHHLQHLQSGKQSAVVDFSVVNVDSVFYAVALGVIGCWLLWLAARKATSGVPGQNGLGDLAQGYVETSNVNVVEELVAMIQTQRAYELNSKAIQTSDQMLQRLGQL